LFFYFQYFKERFPIRGFFQAFLPVYFIMAQTRLSVSIISQTRLSVVLFPRTGMSGLRGHRHNAGVGYAP
jgi:hypothetical protein